LVLVVRVARIAIEHAFRHPGLDTEDLGHPAVAVARAAATMGSAADAMEGGGGEATLGTGAAVDVAGVARGATENAVCNVVNQLSDPLKGQVI
jgi:hypothetical protein